ncbi:MAG: protein kinase [Planctomycetes bacterium]|nr:protein kinase [Planctomycetota bacterium]
MANKIDDLFAEIALARKFVTRQEVEEARRIQAESGNTRRIGTILLSHKYITKGQADSILGQIRQKVDTKTSGLRRPEPEDAEATAPLSRESASGAGVATDAGPLTEGASRIDVDLARLAVDRGYVREKDLVDCVAEQTQLQKTGKKLRLGQLFLKRGLISADQFMELVREGKGKEESEQETGDGEQASGFRLQASGEKEEAVRHEKASGRRRRPDPNATPADPSKETARRSRAGPLDATRLESNRRFGPFAILSEIARGGMGIVYRARQENLDRVVALKVLRDGKRATDVQIERFEKEIDSAGRLQHPNIVRVHEYGQIEGDRYFTMEFVEGTSLEQEIQAGRTKRDPHQSAQWMAKIAQGVHYAHEMGVIHRDLKPGNILLDLAGEPKITDFGLAKVSDSVASLTKTEQALGTPAYMSPEQARGDSKYLDRRSDVFSLGTIFYQMITGRLPFEATTSLQLFHKILHTDPVAPRKIHRTVPRDLETICLKALEKDIARRYQAAGELASDLDRYLAGEPIHASPPSFASRQVRRLRRHALKIVFPVAVAVVVAFAWGILSVLERRDARAAERREEYRSARRRESQAMLDEGRRHLAAGRYRDAIRALDAFLALDRTESGPARTTDTDGTVRELLENEEVEVVDEADVYEALLARGRARAAVGGIETAEADFQAARELHATAVEPLVELARLAQSRGRLEAALELARAAIELAPELPSPPRLLGGILAEMGRLDEAEEAYGAAFRLVSDSSPRDQAELRGARGLVRMERFERSVLGPERLPFPILPAPAFDPARLAPAERAAVLAARDDLAAAVAGAGVTPALLVALAFAHHALASGGEAAQESAQAWERYDEAVSLPSAGWRAQLARAVYRIVTFRFAGARSDVEDAVKAFDAEPAGGEAEPGRGTRFQENGPRDAECGRLHLVRAVAALYQGDAEAAGRALDAAESLLPGSALVAYYRGLLEEVQGRPAAAAEAYRKSLSARPGFPHAAERLIMTLAGVDAPSRAEARRVLASVPALSWPAGTRERLLAEIELADDRPLSAYKILLPVLESRPDWGAGLAVRAAAYEAAKDGPKARRDFPLAEEALVRDAAPHALLAEARRLAKFLPARAVFVFSLLSVLEPRCAVAHYERAILRLSRGVGDAGEVRADLSRAVEANPCHRERLLDSARTSVEQMGDAAMGLAIVERLLEAVPGDPMALLWKGILASEVGSFESGVEPVEEAVRRAEVSPPREREKASFYRRAAAFLEEASRRAAAEGQSDDASRLDLTARSCRERAAGVLTVKDLVEQAENAEKASEYQKSFELYTQAIEEFPDDPDLWNLYYQRGQVGLTYGYQQFGLGNTKPLQEALLDYARALELNFGLTSKFFRKVEQFQLVQQIGPARGAIQKIFEDMAADHPEESAAHFLLGVYAIGYVEMLLEGKFGPEHAEQVDLADLLRLGRGSLERALELNPNHVIARVLLGYLHQRLEEYDQALGHYHAALEMGIGESFVHFYLASFYARQRDLDRTLDHLGKVFELEGGQDENHRREAAEGLVQRIELMEDFRWVRTSATFQKFLDEKKNGSGK